MVGRPGKALRRCFKGRPAASLPLPVTLKVKVSLDRNGWFARSLANHLWFHSCGLLLLCPFSGISFEGSESGLRSYKRSREWPNHVCLHGYVAVETPGPTQQTSQRENPTITSSINPKSINRRYLPLPTPRQASSSSSSSSSSPSS